MTDEQVTKSPEEIAATVAKLEAEALKFRTEAAIAQIDLAEKQRLAEVAAAVDERNHVYRFNEVVGAPSARKAAAKLTEWHRLDPGCDIEIIFDSPGGSVFDGLALFDHLRWLSSQGHSITTGAQGMAASMAGILTQAGDHRWMSSECWFLIHRVSFMTMGSSYEVEDRVEHIKRIEKRVIDIFSNRSEGKLTKTKIKRNWDRKDWWLSSDDCLELGIIDEVRGTL